MMNPEDMHTAIEEMAHDLDELKDRHERLEIQVNALVGRVSRLIVQIDQLRANTPKPSHLGRRIR